MIAIYESDKIKLSDILDRERKQSENVSEIVDEILCKVRAEKDAALFAYEKQFDHVALDCLEISKQEIKEALIRIDPDFRVTLEAACENIRNFHKHQLRNGFLISEKNGVVLGQKITPIERAGIYVPGGTASYPSSVLMNAIPAKLAGVEEIIMVTPPDRNGNIADNILAAANIAGVTRIFKIGGAQAIAALAYGTESVPKVDKIVGPGNIFVATAKSKVYGKVDIDMIAGPSEILVLADGTCNPSFVAADLLSQAEHDPLASAVLVTDSRELAEKVQREIEQQLSLLSRGNIARESIHNNGKIILASSLSEAVEIANNIAPEHLEVCVDDPFSLLSEVKNAGSIFLGKYAPEALGDYFAGSNHILPTSGTARFSSPLSVDDFIKKSSFIYYTKDALREVKDRVADFAEREGLGAHAKSITIRFEEE
ncbi:histidinol dehydrogenase [Sinanaerobacter sp. ZZT-01]|uniref:histidinol dehydrogenase n=1 Tax=Sinanaerobacter sp. ZZT-01 TaxID=3111540 RepID=UPI002D770622|nr:histidinol dehydrogenase [Sinanaerobacter sp. ZZT-01]WRR92120.1 histidinol dehydrogenase [Sinanaerobacter sp. ZZT-01]